MLLSFMTDSQGNVAEIRDSIFRFWIHSLFTLAVHPSQEGLIRKKKSVYTEFINVFILKVDNRIKLDKSFD